MIQSRIPIEPTRISTIACVIRSLLTTGADGRQAALLGDRAELGLERRGHRAERALGRDLAVLPERGRRRTADGARRRGEPTRTERGGLALGARLMGWPTAHALELAAGEPLARRLELALGECAELAAADGTTSRKSAGLTVLISMKPEPVGDRRRLEALLREDGLDLVGRHVRVLEPDLPVRAAGVVDRELQAAALGERRQQDEDQARDREEPARRG